MCSAAHVLQELISFEAKSHLAACFVTEVLLACIGGSWAGRTSSPGPPGRTRTGGRQSGRRGPGTRKGEGGGETSSLNGVNVLKPVQGCHQLFVCIDAWLQIFLIGISLRLKLILMPYRCLFSILL